MSVTTHDDRGTPLPTNADPTVQQPQPVSTSTRWRSATPTIIVIATLAGLALWGHSSEWTLPNFSALIAGGEAQVDDWCQDHSVPESQCIECQPKLLPAVQDFGWCKEHGVHQCPFEHPEIAQLKSPAVIEPAMLARLTALSVKPRPENNPRCLLYKRRIQIASAQAMEKFGVDIALVQKRPVIESLQANGEVAYDDTRTAHLPSRVPGTLSRIEKRLGDQVRQGDVLALIDSADVGRAKGEFLQAITQQRLSQANYEKLQPLAAEGAIEGRRFREVEATYQEARIRLQTAQQALINLGFAIRAEDFAAVETDAIGRRLQFLGLPAELVSSFDPQLTSSNLFPLRASLAGVVVERDAVEGEVVDARAPLFTVTDVGRLWLTLNVRQEDAKYVTLGQTVLFQASDSQHEAPIKGQVGWVSTAADEQTRTVQVRVFLPNPDGRLRANTFGTGRIVLRDEPEAIVVPSEAVHWDGTCHVVFVRDKNYFDPQSPKFFHVRSVRVGVKEADFTEIIAGLLPGEVIASKNSVVLEAQLLKGNLGAGCCEVHSK